MSRPTEKKLGSLLLMVLVFGSVFFVIVGSFISYVVTQNQLIRFNIAQEKASEIAEAGLNYYRWYLAHNPGDTTDGTGQPGPYVHVYSDPEDGPIGEFSLSVASTTYCGEVTAIDVSVTAHTYKEPEAVMTISARYSRPTVANYSFISNNSNWYGADRVISGPVHSNQGVRMDGQHNSLVSSGQSEWVCDDSFGCDSSQVVDGVYTTSGNANPGLFVFPVSPVDFGGLTIDLGNMKQLAQDEGGIFYGKSNKYGYLLTFNSNKTVTIRKVNTVTSYYSYSTEEGWNQNEKNVIGSTSLVATRSISDSCPLLYFEDKVWVQGDIAQKVSLAAANLSTTADTNMVINNHVRYVSGTNAGLLAIAKTDVDVGLVVPDDLYVDGIFVAQNGRFGRDHYESSRLISSLRQYVFRDTLDHNGSVVSNGRGGTQWSSNDGNIVSGFLNRISSFDQTQVNDPPPLTPETSEVYMFSEWKQR